MASRELVNASSKVSPAGKQPAKSGAIRPNACLESPVSIAIGSRINPCPHFIAARLRIACTSPFPTSFLGCGTATLRGLVGCSNWRWQPRARLSGQPAAGNSLMNSRLCRGRVVCLANPAATGLPRSHRRFLGLDESAPGGTSASISRCSRRAPRRLATLSTSPMTVTRQAKASSVPALPGLA